MMQTQKDYRSSLVKFLGVCLFLVIVSSGIAVGQPSASGQTALNVKVPEMLILHYFNKVDLSLSASDLTGLIGTELPSGDEGATTASGFSVDLEITPTDYSSQFTAAVLTLKNAWAVRAINKSGAANTSLKIEVTGATVALADSTADIDITDGKVSTQGVTGASAIDFAAPGFSNPTKGDVILTLDLSNATVAGDYTGATFTLTAENF